MSETERKTDYLRFTHIFRQTVTGLADVIGQTNLETVDRCAPLGRDIKRSENPAPDFQVRQDRSSHTRWCFRLMNTVHAYQDPTGLNRFADHRSGECPGDCMRIGGHDAEVGNFSAVLLHAIEHQFIVVHDFLRWFNERVRIDPSDVATRIPPPPRFHSSGGNPQGDPRGGPRLL